VVEQMLTMQRPRAPSPAPKNPRETKGNANIFEGRRQILTRQLHKSRDNVWATSDDNEDWSPPPQTQYPVTVDPTGSCQDILRSLQTVPNLRRGHSPTFWPPPAMRLLMYSGPSLCLRAHWMAWYSSAVYWLYNPEGKNKLMLPPFLTSVSQQLFGLSASHHS
jgi:hypothetical protein